MKKLSFVFDSIGPNGPCRNGEIPDIFDLVVSHMGTNETRHRLSGPVFHRIFMDDNNIACNVYSSYNLPDCKFLYELSTLECENFKSCFDNRIGFLSYHTNRYISENVLNSIKLKNGYYLISNPFESFLEDHILTSIHNYFNNQQIPLSQIIYVTCSPNANKIYQSYCQRHNITPELKCEFMPIYASNLKKSLPIGLTHEYKPGYRNKDFLCFNRRYRDHRIMFGLLLEKNNLLEHFYFSLSRSQPENGKDFMRYLDSIRYNISSRFKISMDSILELDDGIINSFYSKLPLVLDTSDFDNLNMIEVNDTLSNLYNNSLIHIISETNFFTPIIHQTEKTIKPIANLQPFIMLGSPDSLKSIKDMGFKTFDKFWDESYDNEYDDNRRLIKIAELCKTISEWSSERKIEFTHEVKEIVDYNYNHFINGRLVELDRWIEKYGN